MEQAVFPDADRMTPAEIEISEETLRFARSNKKSIAKRLTDIGIYPPWSHQHPSSWQDRPAQEKQIHQEGTQSVE